MKARAILVKRAILRTNPRTKIFIFPLVVKSSMQVSSSVKAALTHVWTSFIWSSNWGPFREWFSSVIDLWSSYTESLTTSTHSIRAAVSPGFKARFLVRFLSIFDVDCVVLKVTRRAVMARSLGLVLISVAYFARVLLHKFGYNVVSHDFLMYSDVGRLVGGLMAKHETLKIVMAKRKMHRTSRLWERGRVIFILFFLWGNVKWVLFGGSGDGGLRRFRI